MDNDPFYSARLRIARAQEHLKDLEIRIDGFFQKKPYTRIVEPDPDGLHDLLKIRLTERFPFRWRILATEVIEHARASLDHATWATAYLNTRNRNLEFAVFPFVKNPAKLAERIKGVCKDCPPEIQALLATFKPYKGGNDLLYLMNDMCNLSKHVLVAFMARAWAGAQMHGFAGPDQIELIDPLILDPMKNEIAYARVSSHLHFEHDVDFTIFPTLDYREITIGDPAVMILGAMIHTADKIISEIEAESRRIGLIT
jgi:hypothetical protein